jgi:putative salt-induced outer membrane protein
MTTTSLARHPLGLATAALFALGATLFTDAQAQTQPQPPLQATIANDDQWRGAGSLGASATGGNARASSLTLAADAVRSTAEDRTTAWGSVLQSRADGRVTADQLRLGARQDRRIDTNWFAFGGLDVERNQLANLALRGQLGGGLGLHLLATPVHTVDVMGGLAYSTDRYETPSLVAGELRDGRSYASLLLGEESSHRLQQGLTLRQRATLLPRLGDLSDYRATWSAGLSMAVSKAVALNVGYGLTYASEPGLSRRKLDTLATTGLTVRFE